jgi:transposase InsO family protein
MRAADAGKLRQDILTLLNEGRSPSEVAKRLRCSRTTVHRVARLAEDGNASLADGRLGNKGRPVLYAQEVWEAILRVRHDHPSMGALMLYHVLLRDGKQYGIAPEDLPSPRLIGLAIEKAGLAHKLVGPRSKTTFPADQATAPGLLTLDTWGPWTIRATRLYLITIQDRFTRLSAALPIVGRPHGTYTEMLKLTAKSWGRALEVAARHLVPEKRIRLLYCDNGIGLAPAFGHLTQALRHALALGIRVVFIPPAEPWRNGRLERFHWSMEREYFRLSRPGTQDEACAGLIEWLNYYNTHRPHSALRHKAPADLAPWYRPLADGFWNIEVPDHPQPVEGRVDAIRLVRNDGVIELWEGQGTRISSILAGQYVRVEFTVTGRPSIGRIVYNRKRGEDIVVATFNHTLDAPGSSGHWLVTNLVQVDFDDSRVPGNTLIDDTQLAAQRERVQKRGRGAGRQPRVGGAE